MKKFVVAAVIVGVFTLYSLMHAHSGGATFASATAPNANTATSVPPTATTIGGTPPPPTAIPPTPTNVPGAQYKDGSYTGSVADAQWGYIQVKAIIQSGKITDVKFLQYPNERQRSVEINSYADPLLTSEAIQAQNAQVDAVSGATDSSYAFMQSLTDALTSAHV